MVENISIEGIAYIVERIAERAREASRDSKEDREDCFKGGRGFRYFKNRT